MRAAVPALGLGVHLDVELDLVATSQHRYVEMFGSRAVAGRTVALAAQDRRTNLPDRLVRGVISDAGIGLEVLAGVVVERLAGLLIDALGPVDVVHVRLGAEDLAVMAVHSVDETVARRMRDELARLAG